MASIYKRGENYWGRHWHKGRDLRKPLETTSRAVAQERLAKWIEELKAERWGEKPRRTFDEAVKRYGEEHVKTLKPRTRVAYVRSLMKLSDYLEGKYLDEISSGILSEYERDRRKAGNANSTIRHDLFVLSGIYSLAALWEWHNDGNPAAAYLNARKRQGFVNADPKTRYLSHEEERAILRHIQEKRRTAKGNRDTHGYMMLEVGYCFAIDTGLRKEEQLSLLWSDIDLERRQITIRKEITKSKRQRSVPILPRTLALLRALPRNAHSNYVFWNRDGERYTDIYRQLVRIVAKLGMPHLSWHDLRRTCGCRLLQDYQMPIERVSLWLGHQNVGTTEKTYAFLDVRHLHSALETRVQNWEQSIAGTDFVTIEYDDNSGT